MSSRALLGQRLWRWHNVGFPAGALTTLVLAVLALIVVAAPPAAAQDSKNANGGITLTVRDSSGIAIAGAELLLPSGVQRGLSDDEGVFHIVGLIAGPTIFKIRRLGFRPESISVEIAPGIPVAHTLVLRRVAQTLAPVVVQASLETMGRMAGFWQRRLSGNGHFYTRNDIDKQNLMQLTDLFRMIPGMTLSNRGLARNSLRMRNAPGNCWPLVWLDNNPLGAGEFDLDNIQPNSIEALEVYSGPAQVPAQFMGPRGLGACGVIVIWTREGERKPKKIKNPVTASQLAEMVASLKVFTADQVEHPVVVDSSLMTAPQYPDSLFAAAVAGHVLTEFVVDTLGRVEQETLGVVQATHRLFGESVRRAVLDAHFGPASNKGHKVRQFVQLPFSFVPDSSVVRRGGRR